MRFYICKTRFVARESITTCCYYVLHLKKSPILSMASRCISSKTRVEMLRRALIQCVSLPPPSRPPPQATSQTNLHKKTVDLTGTPVFLHVRSGVHPLHTIHEEGATMRLSRLTAR